MRFVGEAVWLSVNCGELVSSRVTIRGRSGSYMSREVISGEAGEGRSAIPSKALLKASGITEGGDTGLSGRL